MFVTMFEQAKISLTRKPTHLKYMKTAVLQLFLIWRTQLLVL